MKFYFDKRVMSGFSITMVVLVILCVFSYNTTQRLIDTTNLQSHATRVMNNAKQLIRAIVDMETGQRGFVITRSTVMDNTERKKSQTRILDLNQELEGFTYSVSHDLRAPLRSIIRYANILKEEQYDKMDVEGKRIIEVIIRNTIRMGQLIDHLLDFFRLGRKQIIFSTVNMKDIVESIVREQTAEIKDLKLAIKILELGPAKGDLTMIRQVCINLLSNALKYASKKEITQIEIGSFIKDSKKVYYLSDNGAGFAMRYGDKLFGVFQRLHKMNEFEGTGVGLALVKTIIKRHGGDVWAEGKIKKGANFVSHLINTGYGYNG
jgi:light-regulated signal transduction histidine kinase (bacteriophytochrome)